MLNANLRGTRRKRFHLYATDGDVCSSIKAASTVCLLVGDYIRKQHAKQQTYSMINTLHLLENRIVNSSDPYCRRLSTNAEQRRNLFFLKSRNDDIGIPFGTHKWVSVASSFLKDLCVGLPCEYKLFFCKHKLKLNNTCRYVNISAIVYHAQNLLSRIEIVRHSE